MLQSTQFHIQSSSFNVACWCKRRLQVGGLHRDKFWLILKPRFGDLQTWNSSVHASSKLELATWRWWDASPGVVVQHLGLSVFSTAGIKHRLFTWKAKASRRICVFEVRPCIPMCWSEAKMKALDFMSSHASHLYSWMLFAFDLKLWFLLLKNFKFLTFNLVYLASLHTLDLFAIQQLMIVMWLHSNENKSLIVWLHVARRGLALVCLQTCPKSQAELVPQQFITKQFLELHQQMV